MDETDFIILKKLLENSRVTYRELAEMIDMSVSGLHKRINKLVEDGIIDGFIARPSTIALKYLWVLIFGTSDAKSMGEIGKELGQHESVKAIAIAGNKFFYISAYLRNISELQEFSTYVIKTAQISEPTVGIVNTPFITEPEPLTAIDYKVLKSLNKDSRKSITDVTDDTGLSPKTVRKRLDRMIENNLAEFTIEMRLLYKDCFVNIFHLFLNKGSDINSILNHIDKKYSQNFSHCLNYSNIPNFITMHSWAKNPQDSQKIQEELETEGFKDIVPHIFLSMEFYDCWLDQLLRTK